MTSWPEGVRLPAEIDPQRPSAARVYDYFLGGTHNFAADRQVASAVLAAMPDLPNLVRANRAFLRRAVTAVAAAGVDQFLDLGSGIPTEGNVHEIARGIHPHARVLYVDTEPAAVVHGRAILAADPYAEAVQADLTDAVGVLAHPTTTRLIDFDRPACVLLVAVLDFIADTELVGRALGRYRDAVPSGSYLVLSHACVEGEPAEQVRQIYSRTTSPLVPRGRAEFARLLSGWDPVDPGVTWSGRWRPDPTEPAVSEAASRSVLVAVARKP